MRGKSFGTELKCMCMRVCAYALAHIWMVFGCPLSARATSVGESGAGGELENTRGSSRRRE